MTGGAVAAGLLLAALALAAGFAPLRMMIAAIALAALAALVCIMLGASAPEFIAFAGCWISLLVTTLVTYWPGIANRRPIAWPVLGVNAGVWAALVLDTQGGAGRVAVLAALLLVAPSRFCVNKGWLIAPRVVASWLIAVAILVGSIPYLVEHPGYVPDHMM